MNGRPFVVVVAGNSVGGVEDRMEAEKVEEREKGERGLLWMCDGRFQVLTIPTPTK